jgi:sulfonate transport system substrate-binding protein
VTEDFSNKYPAATGAVVRAIVKAANWAAQPQNHNDVLDIYAKSGTPRKVLGEDLSGPFKESIIPLIDELFVAGLKISVDFSARNKLIRQPFDVDAWIDRRYDDAALRDLKLVSYWQPRHAPPSLAKQ